MPRVGNMQWYAIDNSPKYNCINKKKNCTEFMNKKVDIWNDDISMAVHNT